jgi:hypothetical protein
MNKVTSKFIEMKLLGNIPRAMKILEFLNILKLNVRIRETGRNSYKHLCILIQVMKITSNH